MHQHFQQKQVEYQVENNYTTRLVQISDLSVAGENQEIYHKTFTATQYEPLSIKMGLANQKTLCEDSIEVHCRTM